MNNYALIIWLRKEIEGGEGKTERESLGGGRSLILRERKCVEKWKK